MDSKTISVSDFALSRLPGREGYIQCHGANEKVSAHDNPDVPALGGTASSGKR